MTDKTYNGWTNYATWRVNLEIFDGASCNDYYIGSFLEPYDVGLALKEHAEEFIEQSKIKVLFSGILSLPLYDRYMIIGKNVS